MKKIIFLMAFIVLFANSVHAANLPEVLVETISPQPVSPGQDLSVTIILSNSETQAPINNVPVTLETTYPFILKSSEYDIASGIDLCADCKFTNTYFLTVDSGAVSGVYNLYVKVSKDGIERITTINVRIVGTPNIIFTTGSDLQNIIPDTAFDAAIDLQNIGSGTAREIKITINSSSIISLGGSTKTLSSLSAGKTGTVNFNLIVSENMEAGSYNIPIRLTYLDESGNTISSTETLGARVANQGLLNVQSITVADQTGSTYIVPGKQFVVIARIENVGHGTADFISATLNCPFNGESTAFLGQLDKNEDAPAVFSVVSKESGTFDCALNINFKDDTGEHVTTQNFNIIINSPDLVGPLVSIIIILLILFILRKRIIKLLKGI